MRACFTCASFFSPPWRRVPSLSPLRAALPGAAEPSVAQIVPTAAANSLRARPLPPQSLRSRSSTSQGWESCIADIGCSRFVRKPRTNRYPRSRHSSSPNRAQQPRRGWEGAGSVSAGLLRSCMCPARKGPLSRSDAPRILGASCPLSRRTDEAALGKLLRRWFPRELPRCWR